MHAFWQVATKIGDGAPENPTMPQCLPDGGGELPVYAAQRSGTGNAHPVCRRADVPVSGYDVVCVHQNTIYVPEMFT